VRTTTATARTPSTTTTNASRARGVEGERGTFPLNESD
jgi:hypothetical protein